MDNLVIMGDNAVEVEVDTEEERGKKEDKINNLEMEIHFTFKDFLEKLRDKRQND